MKRNLYRALLCVPIALPVLTPAHAESDASSLPVTITGYGTLAYTATGTDQADFVRYNHSHGARKSPVSGVDSNLGIQGTWTANDWLSVTGQGLARKLVTDAWGAELYWAYAKAKINKEWSVLAGRVVAPIYMISDYRNVGYANTMIRPPQELYSQVPFDSIDGASISYQTSIGDTNLTSQLAVGATREKLAPTADTPVVQEIKISALKALNVVAERGPVTVRVGYAQSNITLNGALPLDALTGGLHSVGGGYSLPQLNQLADALAVNGKKGAFTSIGVALDLDNIYVQGEAGKRKTDSIIPDSTSWYLLGAYRIGKFLPYIAYSSLKSRNSVSNGTPASCPAGYPDACTPTLQALSGSVDAALASGITDQTTTSIGLRWNFSRTAAFKMQFDRVRPKNGNGLLTNVVPGFHDAVNVFAAGVDFVF